jgi:hypothetical protein
MTFASRAHKCVQQQHKKEEEEEEEKKNKKKIEAVSDGGGKQIYRSVMPSHKWPGKRVQRSIRRARW